MSYIDRSELEACLLSRSMLSSLVRLFPTSEYDLWVQEMTIAVLDFKNPVSIETFNCFKRVCIIERNTTESSRSDPVQKEVQCTAVKNVIKLTYKVHQQEGDSSGSETEATIHAMSGPVPKLWNPPPGLKFPCPMTNHKHEVSTCAEFFRLSPLDRWEKIEKDRMCFSCLSQIYLQI